MLKGLQLHRTGHKTRAEDELTYAQRRGARKTLPQALGKLFSKRDESMHRGKRQIQNLNIIEI